MYKEGIHIDASRLREKLEGLADLARTPEGICRLTFTPAYARSCDYVQEKMEQAGMTVQRGKLGNVVGIYPGETDRRIVLGSHIDSVPNGGMFDGCLGVMGAIEAVRALHEKGIRLRHTVEVVAFAEEEGATISSLVGSRAFCGLPLEPLQQEKIARFGVTSQDVEACRETNPIDFSLELHIEQGGVLDTQGISIGVVTGIVSQKLYELEFSGKANHAGTTPMDLRDDALVKAARLISFCAPVAKLISEDMVITVGRLEVFPGATNVVPEKVRLSLEIRAREDWMVDKAYERLMEQCGEDVSSFRLLWQEPAHPMDSDVMDAILEAARMLGLSHKRMVSGAGHDSMTLSQVTRSGMIFVPSVGGLSHCKEEYTRWEDCAAGCDVLLHTLFQLDHMEG